jgi:glutamate racemase
LIQKNQSIGIFDSGIGGLTVANAISHLLPNEHIVYYGDTEHMPYGEKSQDLIKTFSKKITKFLIENKNCKTIVIACNTASAAAYDELKEAYLGQIPIINVIDPMVEHIVASDYKKVGIIATRGTIESNVYQSKLQRRKPEQDFAAMATPLLASMIEESFINNEISHAILHEYVSHAMLKNIDALVLACTHYPLIANEIDAFFAHKVHLLNSAKVVAEKLKWILEKENLISDITKVKKNEFLVSDLTENFVKSTQLFYGEALILKEQKL